MNLPLDGDRRLNRRRFLMIAAAAAGVGSVSRNARTEAMQTTSWRGIALGAPATLTLQHPDALQARDAIAACLEEVARLEAIFSLHRADSALARLNRDGHLDGAPADLRILLAQSLALAAQTGGRFDPTIQPVWELYARHFSTLGASPDGPDVAEVAQAGMRVGWQNVRIDGGSIAFRKPGMALTLNGIAQGYITDKISEVLHARGLEHVLVDMGEQRALGPKWDGTAWRVGLRDPYDQARTIETIPVASGAVATSSCLGPGIDPAGRFGHILEPRSGRPAALWASVTVVSASAAHADGLSTALSLLPENAWRPLLGTTSRAFVLPIGAQQGHWV